MNIQRCGLPRLALVLFITAFLRTASGSVLASLQANEELAAVGVSKHEDHEDMPQPYLRAAGAATERAASDMALSTAPGGSPNVGAPAIDSQPWEIPFAVARYAFLIVAIVSFYFFGLRWDMRDQTFMDEDADLKGTSNSKRKSHMFKAELEAVLAKDIPEALCSPGSSSILSSEDMPLPTIWPKFIKLHSATQLYIPAGSFDAEDFSAHVFQSTGSPIMYATNRSERDGGRILELATTGVGGFVLASVGFPSFTFCGLGAVSIGHFQQAPGGDLHLCNGNGQPILAVSGDPLQHRELLSMPSGRRVGTIARREANQAKPYAHFELLALPGVVLVLIVACALTELTRRMPPQALNEADADLVLRCDP